VEAAPQKTSTGKRPLIKALFLLAFIVAAVLIVRFTPVKSYLTREALGQVLESAGYWAPLLFILVYTLGICLFVPGTLLTTVMELLSEAPPAFPVSVRVPFRTAV